MRELGRQDNQYSFAWPTRVLWLETLHMQCKFFVGNRNTIVTLYLIYTLDLDAYLVFSQFRVVHTCCRCPKGQKKTLKMGVIPAFEVVDTAMELLLGDAHTQSLEYAQIRISISYLIAVIRILINRRGFGLVLDLHKLQAAQDCS